HVTGVQTCALPISQNSTIRSASGSPEMKNRFFEYSRWSFVKSMMYLSTNSDALQSCRMATRFAYRDSARVFVCTQTTPTTGGGTSTSEICASVMKQRVPSDPAISLQRLISSPFSEGRILSRAYPEFRRVTVFLGNCFRINSSSMRLETTPHIPASTALSRSLDTPFPEPFSWNSARVKFL